MRKIFAALTIFLLFAAIVSADIKRLSKAPSGNVQISFDGLQALCFGNPNQVGVGVLNVAHHTPKLTINRIKGTSKTEIATLTNSQLNGLTIGLSGSSQGISRFTPGMHEPADFRHTIDMESDIFQKQLHLKTEALIAKIQILDGRFYSTGLSEEKYSFVSGTTRHSFNRSVADPAAALTIQPGQALTITGGKEPIVLSYQEGVSYQIDITNLPPADMANMNHFLYYFDALKDQGLTRYEPFMVNKAAFSPRPLLCQSIIFSKSTID